MPRDINILIRDMPDAEMRIIDTLATLHRRTKWMVVRDALVEYAEHHKGEIPDLAGALAGLPESDGNKKKGRRNGR